MKSTHALSTVPDDELLRRLVDLLHHSRRAEADLVAHIGEVDARRLYAREASPSMFAYCTERLHLSDAEAYLRIAAARASREHPVLLDMLADGRLHLTAIAKLAPHLTAENGEALLQRATHRSKRQIEELVAELAPRPDVPARLRKLPDRRGGSPARIEVRPDPAEDCSLQLRPDGVVGQEVGRPAERAASRPEAPGNDHRQLRPDAAPGSPMPGRSRPTVVEPLAPGRYRLQFTASAELRDKLERLRGLMRASVPDGDLAAIIEQAVTEKLERLEARRFARAKVPETAPARPEASPASGRSPATASRHIPAAVRRAVHERDQGRCRYVDERGQRCTAREGLEFHHRHPFGYGGGHTVDGISLLCRAHNRYLAEVDYGRQAVARHRQPPTRSGNIPLRI